MVALVFAFLQTTDFVDRQNNYNNEKDRLNESRQIKVFSEAQKTVLIKPNPLSIFSKGVDEKVGNKMVVSVTDIPDLHNDSQQRNPFLSIFTSFDTISIITFLISLLVFLTVSNGISEEREKGTIKLVFSNSISKTEYFLSKYFAYLILSILPIVILFSCNIIFILLNNLIELTLTEYLRILLLFVSSILFISTITLTGLVISFYCKTVQKSVILNLSIWLVFIFIYPNSVGLIVSSNKKIVSHELNETIKQIKRNFLIKSIKISDEVHHHKDMDCITSLGFDDPYLGFLTKAIDITQKYHYEYLEEYHHRIIPELFSMQNEIINLKTVYRNSLYEKNKTINNYTFFLPTTSFSKASEKLACTDLYSRYEFIIQQGVEYRKSFMQYLQNRKAFGLNFFTQMPKHEMRDDFNAYSIDASSAFLYNNYKNISIEDFPEFNYRYAENFPKELFILIILNILLLLYWLYISNSKSNSL
jgi:ABC-type transport system involved in multi-copper enzyme maturation permease subunit